MPQTPATEDEMRERSENLRTQGRLGCHSPRINLAFTDSNYAFVRLLSRSTGYSMTRVVNRIMEAYRNEHSEIMEQAQRVIDEIACGTFTVLGNKEGEKDEDTV